VAVAAAAGGQAAEAETVHSKAAVLQSQGAICLESTRSSDGEVAAHGAVIEAAVVCSAHTSRSAGAGPATGVGAVRAGGGSAGHGGTEPGGGTRGAAEADRRVAAAVDTPAGGATAGTSAAMSSPAGGRCHRCRTGKGRDRAREDGPSSGVAEEEQGDLERCLHRDTAQQQPVACQTGHHQPEHPLKRPRARVAGGDGGAAEATVDMAGDKKALQSGQRAIQAKRPFVDLEDPGQQQQQALAFVALAMANKRRRLQHTAAAAA